MSTSYRGFYVFQIDIFYRRVCAFPSNRYRTPSSRTNLRDYLEQSQRRVQKHDDSYKPIVGFGGSTLIAYSSFLLYGEGVVGYSLSSLRVGESHRFRI